MSESGQHGGGLSFSLKSPTDLGWDTDAADGAFLNFYRTAVPTLWSKLNLENGWTKEDKLEVLACTAMASWVLDAAPFPCHVGDVDGETAK